MILITSILACLCIGISIYNFLSGKKLVTDFFHYLKLRQYSLDELDLKWSMDSDKSDIIISLTTIPERIDHLGLTIGSLLLQRRSPNKIHLYIPYKSFRNNVEYHIPKWISKLKSVEINRIKEDFGPASKFIPALKTCHNTQKILVVDDDNIYPPNYVFDFEKAETRNPDVILAASGWRVPDNLIDKPTTLWSNIKKKPPTPIPGTRINVLYQTDIIQGYSGYLIKPAFFDLASISNFSNVPQKIRFVDDVWISAHANVLKYIFPISRFCYTPFFRNKIYKASSLAKINNWDKQDYSERNNSIALRYFREKWKPDDP